MSEQQNNSEKAQQSNEDQAASGDGLDSLLPIDEHVEEVSEDGKKVQRSGIYLLPNLVTTGALFAGFYAVISAMHGNFEAAAIAILFAMLFDGLDGRIARATNTQSAFGVEYDSLADMVSFGVSPALVMFSWALSGVGKLGWAAAFVYVACAALRLAKFNTQAGKVDKRYFSGLASPPAAALIASTVWVFSDAGYQGLQIPTELAVFAVLLTALTGLLMVINVPYYSFKSIDKDGRVPFVSMLLIVLVFVVFTLDPPLILMVVSGLYALSGPALFAWKKLRP